jgi:hypothetical protein
MRVEIRLLMPKKNSCEAPGLKINTRMLMKLLWQKDDQSF